MTDSFDGAEIAIIGMAGRYPRSRNLDEFWEHLRNGDELISFFTDEELLARGVDRAVLASPQFVKAAVVLDDMDLFDASFFGFTRREAELLDPQHRLFLETAWEALENAGYSSDSYSGLIWGLCWSRNKQLLPRQSLQQSELWTTRTVVHTPCQ